MDDKSTEKGELAEKQESIGEKNSKVDRKKTVLLLCLTSILQPVPPRKGDSMWGL